MRVKFIKDPLSLQTVLETIKNDKHYRNDGDKKSKIPITKIIPTVDSKTKCKTVKTETKC